MFIGLVVVVVPEHLSYSTELGEGGRGTFYWIFCSKEGQLEEAIHINCKHRQKCWEGWLLFSSFLLLMLNKI